MSHKIRVLDGKEEDKVGLVRRVERVSYEIIFRYIVFVFRNNIDKHSLNPIYIYTLYSADHS